MAGSFQDRRVLVTGASGFIGSHLARRLLELGAEVHGVSRLHQPADRNGLHWWQCDLRDPDSCISVVRSIEPALIFHLSSFVSGDRRIEAVLPTLQHNLVSAVNLLVAGSNTACERIVLAGSLEEPEAETPVSPYAAAKGAATAYAEMFHALYGTPVVVARLFMVYGPGQQDLKKLVPYTALALHRNQVPEIGNGVRPVDWVYIDDVVEGLIACSTSNQVLGVSVDIGSGELVAVGDVVRCLAELSGSGIQPVFGVAPDRGTERIRAADTRDAWERLGWRPRILLRDGLERTFEWYGARITDGTIS